MVKTLLDHYLSLLIIYFLLINLFSIFLIFSALSQARLRKKKYPFLGHVKAHHFPYSWPAISVLSPAHNEEKSIVASVKSLLALNYPEFEVVVVDDGSSDRTGEFLKSAFHMVTYHDARGDAHLRHYRSNLNPNLYLISKPKGGKAEALNVGIGFAKHGLFCAIDSDSLLEHDALLRIAIPFLENPQKTIASGGTVRVINGSLIRGSLIEKIRLPWNFLALLQIVEYSRAFLFGRTGWSQFGSNLLISGAFGLFSKTAVLKVGGYNTHSIGEDMELVVRLHAYFRKTGKPYLIEFNADPVCWTEVPTTLRGLYRQRNRWQRGLADSLLRQKQMFLNPKYGVIGLIGMPYQVFVELLGPAIELTAFLALFIGFVSGYIETDLALLFIVTGLFYSMTASVLALIAEKHYFSRDWSMGHLMALTSVAFIENFGYRQMLSIWRFMGLISFLRGNTTWGKMARTGFNDVS